METLVQLVKDLGFPVFVAVFLLVRIEPTLKKVSDSLNQILGFLKSFKN